MTFCMSLKVRINVALIYTCLILECLQVKHLTVSNSKEKFGSFTFLKLWKNLHFFRLIYISCMPNGGGAPQSTPL